MATVRIEKKDGGFVVHSLPDVDQDVIVLLAATQRLSNKTFVLPQIDDSDGNQQYVFAVSELTADRTITLPLLTGDDVFVFADFVQTLTNKTLTSPTLTTPTITYLTTAGIIASTSQSQGNGALTSEINEVATVANDNDTVTMPSAATGVRCTVINNGANILQIFPASGDDLGPGANTSVKLLSGQQITYQAYDATNWEEV